MQFSYELPVRLSHTDAGKVLYFAQYLSLSHQAYEAFLDARGYSVGRIIDEGVFAMPIVHAEADYKAPAGVSDLLRFEMSASFGTSSIKIHFDIFKNDVLVAKTHLVSVCVSQPEGKAMALPPSFRQALEG